MLVIISSCKKDDPDPVVIEAEVLADYLEAGAITPKTIAHYITAQELEDGILDGDVYMIDIRGSAKYDVSHIEGAELVAFEDLLTHVEANSAAIGTDDIVIICNTGQTAAYGSALLRLAGYTNTYSLKFGMSSWHTSLDLCYPNRGSQYVNDFVTTAFPKGSENDFPTLDTGFDTGAEILADLIDDLCRLDLEEQP